MADCACDFCSAYDEICPYAWHQSNCYVDVIKEARAIADDRFLKFLGDLEAESENLDNDTLDGLIRAMRDIVNTAWEDLPDWAEEEE